jgi:hypothetical protein
MPFLYIVWVSNTEQNFELIYCFLLGETKVDYGFAIQQLYFLYHCYNLKPKVVIIDKEQALKNALHTYFPSVPQLLCL